MRFSDIIAISLTNLNGNRMRTVLTILGIGVGIGTIVFLVSLGYGLQALSIQKIASSDAINTLDVTGGKVATPNTTLVSKYKSDKRVATVNQISSLPAKGSFGGHSIDVLTSVVPSDFFAMEGLSPAIGSFYNDANTRSMVISSALAKGLNLDSRSAVGKKVNMAFHLVDPNNANNTRIINNELTIVGIYQDDSTVIAYVSPDIYDLIGKLPINQVQIMVNNQKYLLPLRNELENDGYSVNSVADTVGQLNTIFKIVNVVLAVFGAIGLFVAAIGMFNTMTIALLERTRDVGIMKATGADDNVIYKLFLTEAIIISVLGGLSGLLSGWLLAWLINTGINALAVSLGGQAVQLFVTPAPFVLLMLGFSFLVGLSTGFLPARRGSQLNPLDALRYE